MIANKKWIISLLCFASIGGFSQNKGDVGMLVSSDFYSRVGLEYRAPLGEQYKWKIGLTGGSYWDYVPSEQIVSATDTTVIMSRNTTNSEQIAVRFGVERQLKESIFSVGLDLNLGYLTKRSSHSNYAQGLNETGQWVLAHLFTQEEFEAGGGNEEYFIRPVAIGDVDFAQIKRHFLNTDLRLSINMDAPVGKSFLVHGSISTVFGVRNYMGASDYIDPKNIYLGSPPSVFNFNTTFNVGLRYLMGSRKK